MKSGFEMHFLAGQLFTLGVAAMAVLPRMPFDKFGTIGGKLSFPFRRALLALVTVGVVRVVICHILFPGLLLLDGILGTIHVVGQSFLCLTTSYLLECQLSSVINISPGSSLLPALLAISALTISGAVLAELVHPNCWRLVNLAETA